MAPSYVIIAFPTLPHLFRQSLLLIQCFFVFRLASFIGHFDTEQRPIHWIASPEDGATVLGNGKQSIVPCQSPGVEWLEIVHGLFVEWTDHQQLHR